MTTLGLAILIAAFGYLAGSLPFGYLTARCVAGIDIRRQGSGNIGATNIGRILGAKWGILVLVLDCLKGLLPVALAPLLLPEFAQPSELHLQVLCGLMTVVGHMFPLWLKFRGGKGVATALGVILGISSWGGLVAFGVFLLTFAVFRIMSVSSMSGAITFAAVQMTLLKPHPFTEANWSAGVFSLMVPALILWRHRSNIGRLLRGEEPRFRFGGKSQPLDAPTDNAASLSGGNGAVVDSTADQHLTESSDR